MKKRLDEVLGNLNNLNKYITICGNFNANLLEDCTSNRWIFVQSKPGKGHFTCEDKGNKYDEILFETRKLFLRKGCKAFYEALQFTDSQTFETKVTNVISNVNLVEDDCCDKGRLNKILSRLPFVKLSSINDFGQLLQASIHLDDFEN